MANQHPKTNPVSDIPKGLALTAEAVAKKSHVASVRRKAMGATSFQPSLIAASNAFGMPPDRLSDQMGAIYRMWLRWSIGLIRHGVIRAGLPSIQTSGEVSSVRALRFLPLRCLCMPAIRRFPATYSRTFSISATLNLAVACFSATLSDRSTCSHLAAGFRSSTLISC